MLSEGCHWFVRIGRTLATALVMCGCAADADEAVALLQTEVVVGMDAGVQDASLDASDARAPVSSRPPNDYNVPRYPPGWPAELPKVLVVKHYGTGCPDGTVGAAVSRDGSLFTITFSNFEVVKTTTQSVNIKDCQLLLKLQSGDAFSYTLESVTGLAYAYLDKGLVGRQIVKANFQGQPNAQEASAYLVGPFDDTFKITYDAPITAPCGRERDLNVRTNLRVVGERDAGRGEGYLSLSALDASEVSHLKIKLRWARCD